MSGDASFSSARRRLASRDARGAEGWRQQHEQRLAALEGWRQQHEQSSAALLDLVEATMPIEEALADRRYAQGLEARLRALERRAAAEPDAAVVAERESSAALRAALEAAQAAQREREREHVAALEALRGQLEAAEERRRQ